MNRKAQVEGLAFTVITLTIVIFFFVFGIIMLQSLSDTVDYADTPSVTESVVEDHGLPTALTHTPLSASVTALNNTWVDFNETGNYQVRVMDSSTLDVDDLTVSFWMRTPTNKTDIIRKWESAGNGRSWSFDTSVTNGHNITFRVANGTNSDAIAVGDSVPVTDNEWHHIVGTFNGTTSVLYVDSVLVGSRVPALSGNVPAVTLSNVFLGNNFITTGEFNGSLDEFRLYNRTLESWEVRASYNESSLGRGLGLRIPILSYHHVRDDTLGFDTIVNTTMFNTQMAYLNSSGYETITLRQYYDWTQGNGAIPDRPVIIMFDDAWNNTVTNAYPTMETYGYVGVAAIITDVLGTGSGITARMGWDEVQNLSDEGWEIASHSINATNMEDSLDPTSAMEDSRDAITGNISITPISFVFPQNAHNDSLDTLCGTYYTLCTGDANGDTAPFYSYRTSDLTGGIHRAIVDNETTLPTGDITKFARMVDRFYENRVWLDLDENEGAVAIDQSGMDNNGTITKATYSGDNIAITLSDNSDYSYNGNQFIINNSEYSYSQTNVTYSYGVQGPARLQANETVSGIGSFGDYTEIIVLAIVISIVLGLIMVAFSRRVR